MDLLIERLIEFAFVLLPLLIGYFMGRHTQGRPVFRQKAKARGNKRAVLEPGTDIFQDALEGDHDPNERIPTMTQ